MQCGVDVRDFLRHVDEWKCRVACARVCKRARPQLLGQWRQPTLTRDGRTRSPLRLIRQIQIFERLLRRRTVHGCLQCIVQLALLVDALQYGGTTLFQLGQILRPVANVAQLHLIQPTRHFLPVTGNERQRVAVREQFKRALNRRNREREFTCDSRNE